MTKSDQDLQLIKELQSFILRHGVEVVMPSGKKTGNPALKMLSWMLTYKKITLPDFYVQPVLLEKETG